MKGLKRVLLLLLCLALVVAQAGCSTGSQPTQPSSTSQAAVPPVVIRLGGMTGATTMGMVRMLKDAEAASDGDNPIDFTLVGAADELTPKLVSAAPELDVAAVPANLASVLYNNTQGQIQLLAVNTLGVLYLVENGESVTDFADLRGKSIYATGRGAVPEYTLRYLLTENGLNPDTDVTIEWKSEPTEVVALMQQNSGSVAMLPQPYVAAAQTNMETLRIAIDLTAAWQALDNGSQLVTGVLVVRRDFAQQNPERIAAFLEAYQASTAYTNENPAEAAALIEEYGIVKAAIAQKAIPFCNITYLAGDEMKQAVSGYLQVLYDQNVKSVGGSIPGDDFYYDAQ